MSKGIIRPAAALIALGLLGGCAVPAGVTIAGATALVTGAVTLGNFDVSLIKEYCELRTGADNCHPGVPTGATPAAPAAK